MRKNTVKTLKLQCVKNERIFTKLSMVFEGIIVYTIQRIYNTALHNTE